MAQGRPPELPISPLVVGIVGAGTMGRGIAEVAALNGYQVRIYDVSPAALEQSRRLLERDLQRRVARGRLEAGLAAGAGARITWVDSLDALHAAGAIIEAAPEDLAVKREIFGQLDQICGPAAILASNTSSLSISAMGAATQHPERVVGMHFFNPVPAMALVEVIRGARTSQATVDRTIALARAFGKTPVVVVEAPGFLVNRIARGFSGEALRLLAERTASAAVIDWIMREAGGFRMGPFELLDLIGLDVNLAVARAIYDAFFQDPRYRPHHLQQRMVDAGLLGRKTGSGFYEYTESDTRLPRYPSGPPGGQLVAAAETDHRAHGPVAIFGDSRVARDLAHVFRGAGLETVTVTPESGQWHATSAIEASVAPTVEKSRLVAELDAHLAPNAVLLTLTLTASTTEAARLAAHPERIVGFATLPPLRDRRALEIQAGLRTSRQAISDALAFWADAGKPAVEVADGVAGVFPRIQAMLCHEAIVALAEGVASAAEIDTAMRLGVNYPQGPIERAEAAGLATILAIMQSLLAEYGDPRYRPVPLLRRLVAAGQERVAALVAAEPR